MTSLSHIARPVRTHLALFEAAYARQFSDASLRGRDPSGPAGGKRLRPLLFFLSQGLIGRPLRRSVPLAVLIELLHAASLVHDDVVDGAHRRRGNPSFAAHRGSRLSVLAGDYLMAKALVIGASIPQRETLRLVSETVLEMTRAELIQNALENSGESNAKTYFRIIRGKTASLFGTACELAGLVQKASSGDRRRLRRFGETFGTAFQIRDDVLDLTGNPKRLGKPIGLDLHNGQLTLPFLYALETASLKERKTILKALPDPSVRNRDRISRFVREKQGIFRAAAEADRRMYQAGRILSGFPPSACRRSLEDLLEFEGRRKA